MPKQHATAFQSVHLQGVPVEAEVRQYQGIGNETDQFVWVFLRAHGANVAICQEATVPELTQLAQAFGEVADEVWKIIREMDGTELSAATAVAAAVEAVGDGGHKRNMDAEAELETAETATTGGTT